MPGKPRSRYPVNKDPGYGPLGRYVETFRETLVACGYAAATIRRKVLLTRHLNHWLQQKHLSPKEVDEQRIARFLRYWRKSHLIHLGDRLTLKNLLGWLRESGVTPVPTLQEEDSDLDRLMQDYARYLRQERALAPATLRNYLPAVRRFLQGRFRADAVVPKELTPKDAIKFLFQQARIYRVRRVQLIAAALRSFLRFLRFRGDLATDWAVSVPTVANRGSPDLPKYLPAQDVDRLLRSCDRTRAVGLRDYAMLLLMARLGLRAGELLTLTLDDIHWETSLITLWGKGHQQESLPIPKDVGEALVRYLKKGRPDCSTRRLFVRARAPFRELARNSSVCIVVRYACRRAGISPQHQGAHLLRHSLATHMLRRGASLAEVSQIMRHRSPQTTEIYAKVDVRTLRELAQPWPRRAR
jgi:site-specific recombinase XerD